jgi:5-methylthioadenosine/S-adenosylhomocysteine deaminase
MRTPAKALSSVGEAPSDEGQRWLLRGGTVLPIDDAQQELRADVRIRGGHITVVAPDVAPTEDETVIDCTGCVILPGFVQTHIHLCQTLFRNLADDLSLLDWLAQRIWPLEASHTYESLSASARLGVGELLLGGTTGLVDMGTVHHTEAIFETLIEGGIRAVAGKCMMDAPDGPDGLREPTDTSLSDSLALAERYDGAANGRIRYGFAPRFVLSCTDGLLSAVSKEAASRGLWVHTHSSENVDEVAIVRDRSGGEGNVAFLARLGIRGDKTVLAHCIHLDDEEITELATAGTHVSHCVSSNLKLGSGVADVPGLIERGVSVSLGADGAPCNNRLDMFTEMRTAALVQKPRYGPTAMPAGDVLALATRAGAKVLGREDDLGQVQPGFVADLQVLRLDGLSDGPGGSLASRIVYAATRQAVQHVFVDGQRLVANGALCRWNKQAIIDEATQALVGCVERAALT